MGKVHLYPGARTTAAPTRDPRLVAFVRAAQLAVTHPQAGVARFLAVVSDDIEDWLKRFITAPDGPLWLSEEHLQSFDAIGSAWLLDGEWGKFWLVPSWMKAAHPLDTDDPRVSPRALKALAQALLQHFQT